MTNVTSFRSQLFLHCISATNFSLGILLACTLLIASSPQAEASNNNDADLQQLYQQTLTAINKGHKTRIQEGMEQLGNYPLYPYLLKAQLQRELKTLPYKQVDAFLKTYGTTIPGKQLHKAWLKTLAQKKQWSQYLTYYQADLSNTELSCWHMEAMNEAGFADIALEQTTNLWLSGKSLPDACDPVFKRWEQAGLKTDKLVWQRVQLALANNNTLLARYLSNHASAYLKPYTRRLISVHHNPRRLKVDKAFSDGTAYSTDIISHGLERLASIDPDLTTKLWVDYRGMVSFSQQQYSRIRDKIARQIIASGRDDALQWLIVQDPNAEDDYLLGWRIRLALRQQLWTQADHWIALLPEQLRQEPRWQYWQARTWQQLQTEPEKTLALFKNLAAQRNYYGFLAADIIEQQYGFNHSDLSNAPDQTVMQTPEIQRAQQFYQMGEMISARREWFAATRQFDQQQLITATNIAHQWGWHQQAIHTTIKANRWDDLTIRFPLAYQTEMMGSANSTTIRPEWLYAITRQESAFGQDAYSSAGARGLMQLLPSTAQLVAQKIGISYNQSDLFQAEKNIALGSNYLKSLLDDFNGNRILATAAYNAGPNRVKKWLERQPATLPHDIWIETLPFHETRNYVQNVLAFSVIYGHRLGLNTPLINPQELFIGHINTDAFVQNNHPEP
ncbi:MAG: transglycosylase SLT domain-containing protein [Spongiibacteraceae bacterium]